MQRWYDMAWMAAVSAIVGLAGSVMQGNAQRQQADETAKILEYNASVNAEDAKAARVAAGEAEKKLQRQQDIMESKQRSYYSKSGFTMSGTPLAMMADTVAQYAIDKSTALWAGEVEAGRYESQGNINLMSARAQKKAGKNAQTNSMLSGVVSTGSSFGKSYVGRT
jgi:hypothetical protein